MNTASHTPFQVNDYIFHGGSGVCIVEDICVPKHIQSIDSSKRYYRLHPLYEANSVIYTPVDNPKSIVRRLLSRKEALELIKSIPHIEALWIDNDKMREAKYREALRTNDCYEWIRMIKTLYLRNQSRKSEGKRPSQADERYLQTAEDLLYGELAVPLDIPKEQVRDYIAEQVRQTEEMEEPCS